MFMSYLRRIFMNLIRPVRTILLQPWKLFQGRSVGRPALSLAAKVAWFVALVLIIGDVVSFFCFLWTENRTFWEAWICKETLFLLFLTVAIPIVVYNLIKLFSQGEVSPFRDIEVAWNAGMRELGKQGIDIGRVPFFLVLGTEDEENERHIFDAAKAGDLAFDFEAVPQGTHPLHWYACRQAIYVACTSTGVLSHLCKVAGQLRESGWRTSGQQRAPAGEVSIQGTLPVGGGLPGSDVPPSPIQGTLRPEARSAGVAPPSPAADQSAHARAHTPIDMTLPAGNAMPNSEGAATQTPGFGSHGEPLKLEKGIANQEEARLEYLAQLIKEARAPICPINGMLVIVPFHLIQVDSDERAAPLATEAVRRDADTLAKMFQLRFPVTLLISGMHLEPGFMEMTRRVGFETARETRFGKGFGIKIPAIPERLEALGTHACGAFEAKVYELFQELGALNKLTGNKKLYSLLCKIRGGISDKVSNLLPDALGSDPEKIPPKESLYIVGCYFAATGDAQNDQQAFLRSVLRQARNIPGELQWTREAIARDQRHRSLGHWLMTASLVLAAVLVLEVFCYLYWDKLFT